MKGILNIVIGAAIIVAILIILYKLGKDKYNDGNSCIVKTKDYQIYTGGDGQRMVIYTFFVSNREYKSSFQLNEEMEKKINNEVYVLFICDSPSVNKLVFDSGYLDKPKVPQR